MTHEVDSVQALEAKSLDELLEAFPTEWEAMGERLVTASQAGPAALAALVAQAEAAAAPWRTRLEKSHHNPQVLAQALPKLAQARLVKLAVARLAQSAAVGVEEGTVRLSRLDAWVVQRLFFSRGLTRKPVSLAAFRWAWPLVRQKRRVLPLLQQKGVYCFYSRALVERLAALIGRREALEVAAGDGTLSRFLNQAGAAVRATDDHSWAHAVEYPGAVERLDALAAVEKYQPRVVLCSFPPPGNRFEKALLSRRHLELYLVVTTRHRFAAGDWKAYQASGRLVMREDPALSRLVLPPEVDPVVVRFEASAS